ncbi:MAG: phosphatase PAP2 family protein [candidate division Zixibacteria bacterium]|nr:phosphatase PAP2 family protein [candidate division Zixibacteria bacterium]
MFHSLLEKAVQVDANLFFLLNYKAQNSVFDFFMPILTNLDYWRIPFILLAIFLLVFGEKRGRIAVLLLVLGIALSDQVCNSVLKPLVGRVRPCNVLESVHLLVNCTKSFSFPSSHATNIFTGMILFSYVYPKLKIGLLTAAALVAYSRVYVGVHYPFDVVAGVILGILCALTVIVLFKLLTRKFRWIDHAEGIAKDQNQADTG